VCEHKLLEHVHEQNQGRTDAKVLAAIRKDKDLAEFDNFGDGWEKQAQMTQFSGSTFLLRQVERVTAFSKLVLNRKPLYLRLVKIFLTLHCRGDVSEDPDTKVR